MKILKITGALHKVEYAIIFAAIIAATVSAASAFEQTLSSSHVALSQRHFNELRQIQLSSSVFEKNNIIPTTDSLVDIGSTLSVLENPSPSVKVIF